MENLKQTLKNEGFFHVFEWTDEPNIEYPKHKHKGKVSFYVTSGSVTLNIEGKEIIVKTGDRFDVPTGVLHTAKVGPEGCTYITGEEIEGDS